MALLQVYWLCNVLAIRYEDDSINISEKCKHLFFLLQQRKISSEMVNKQVSNGHNGA
jgi:hypothetical protein